MSAHFVYIAWNGWRRPLYVGCTNDVPRRLKEHQSGPWWALAVQVTTVEFPSRKLALAAETWYIGKLRPSHNIRDNPAYVTVAEAIGRNEWAEEFAALNRNRSTRTAWLSTHQDATAQTRKWIARQNLLDSRRGGAA